MNVYSAIKESINTESLIEDKLLDLIKAVKSIESLSDIKLQITDEGNIGVNYKNSPLVILNKDNFSEEDLQELKDLGYFNQPLSESSAEQVFDAVVAKTPGADTRMKKLFVTDDYLLAGVIQEDGSVWLRVFQSTTNEVNVYIEQGRHANVKIAQVNWAALGSVSPDEATAYANNIINAANFARDITGKDFSNEFNKED